MLKGKSRLETAENISIALIILGAIVLSVGIGLSILNPAGISAILAMFGAFLSFISTVFLIFIWFFKEWSD
jgi:hypothetical protein